MNFGIATSCVMSELPYFDTSMSDCRAVHNTTISASEYDFDTSTRVEENTTIFASEPGMALQSQMSTVEPIHSEDRRVFDGSLTVSHLNIRSFMCKHDEFQTYLESRNQAHIVGLSETWL